MIQSSFFENANIYPVFTKVNVDYIQMFASFFYSPNAHFNLLHGEGGEQERVCLHFVYPETKVYAIFSNRPN